MNRFNRELLAGIRAVNVYGDAARAPFDRVVCDSRQAGPGAVFVAIPGTKADGHDFIEAACAAGASAIVCERIPEGLSGRCDVVFVVVRDARTAVSVLAAAVEGNPTESMILVGVTGTDGKTSTTMIIESGFEGCGFRTGLLGTVTYRYGGREFKSSLTTPDPITLQKYFSAMKQDGVRAAAMEVSSHAIEQRRVEPCMFDVGIFTNLTRDHLDYHGTVDAYREAKMRLFTEVIPANPEARGVVVNDDDPAAAEIRRRCPLKTVGFSSAGLESSEVRLACVEYTLDGTAFEFDSPWGRKSISTSLIGRHNVANIMAAASAAGLLEIDMDAFLSGVSGLSCIPGRLERVRSDSPVRVFVDYAHTPKAIESILGILRPLVGRGRLIVVCGAGGDRDRGKRPLMGRAAVTGADVVWITSDNPRSEDPDAIIAEIVAGIEQARSEGLVRASWNVEPDRREAIRAAISYAGPADVVVIAGKGHEDYQILKDRTIHFSDVEVAREMLER